MFIRFNRIFLAIIAASFFIPAVSFAYEITKTDVPAQNDFVVEPGKTEIYLNPGESVVKNVSIISRINRPVRFSLTTEDLVGTDNADQAVVLLGEERGPYSLKDLIQPEITEFTLNLGERITIPVRITAPLDAEPRGYYGALIVANDPDFFEGQNSQDAEGKTRIISRIGSLFLVKVNGEGLESGELESFKVIGPSKTFHEKRPEGFEIAYKNTGTVHVVPYGTVTIKNTLGRTVATLPIDAYFALPDSIRYRQVLWDSGFGVGRYTAHLSLYQGYGEGFLEDKISFWILPWKILLGMFALILVIVSLVYYISVRFEIRRK